jgi:hypothetical protein
MNNDICALVPLASANILDLLDNQQHPNPAVQNLLLLSDVSLHPPRLGEEDEPFLWELGHSTTLTLSVKVVACWEGRAMSVGGSGLFEHMFQ